MNTQLALGLSAAALSNTIVINARCTLRAEEYQRVVMVGGLPVFHFCASDAVAAAYAMVMLVDSGFAQQAEVARAFGKSERTVRRYQERYAQRGMTGLEQTEGWRRGRRRISSQRLRSIERFKRDGLSNRTIAQRLGVNEKAIRKLVGPSKSEGLEQLSLEAIAGTPVKEPPSLLSGSSTVSFAAIEKSASSAQGCSPAKAAQDSVQIRQHTQDAEPLPTSLDHEASDRTFDRHMAYRGLLDDAAPMFRDGLQVPGVGVLLALPYLVHSGLLQITRKLYGGIGPAFYGLRSTLLTLFLMALLRIQRPEQLKERDPAAFGRLLGLDRAPEVKTLRRQLSRLAAHHCAEQLGAELARVRVAQRGELMGFLYVDGHVRAYHGKRTISSAYLARRHLAMPATTDYWIHDRVGDPLLVITADVNASMITAFPNLLRQVRATVGERRVTIVFDRGGWSPKLFRSMIQQGFDLLTYRKHKGRLINERRFVRHRAKLDGHWVAYDLHDQPVRLLSGKLRLRQITRLCESGLQTQIMTSRWDLREIEAVYRMFERWRQENFFKYMREEFLLDALVDYRIEAEDPTRTVPNPERRKLDKQIRAARRELDEIERKYGAVTADNTEQHRPTMRGLKIACAKFGKQLRTARERLRKLKDRRRNIPARVQIQDMGERAVVKLATERKHLTDLIKMLAYQAESDLLNLLQPHYLRVEQEGRTLLHEIFAASGDIKVTPSELHITLAPLSSPHRTRAAQALCELLDRTATVFPGSPLRVRFAVRPPPCIGLAFPDTPAHCRTSSAATGAS